MAQVGDRIYEIREALGTRREPMPMRAFSAHIEDTTGVRIDPSEISRKETGERKVTLDDIAAIAAVDPERRGKLWLAWGEAEDATMREPAPAPRARGHRAMTAAAEAVAKSASKRGKAS